MFHKIYTNSGRTVQLTINSVTDSSAYIIVHKYNRVIIQLTFTGEQPLRVQLHNGNVTTSDYYVGNCNYFTMDVTDLIDFPFNFDTYQTYQLFSIRVLYDDGGQIYFNVPVRDALLGKSHPFRDVVTTYRQMPNNGDIIELFSPFDGFLQSGTDTYPINEGMNTVDLTDIGDRFYITNSYLSTFDGTFDYTFQADSTAYLCEIDRVCAIKDDAVVLEYVNYNGEKSYLLGYKSEIENTFEGDNYRNSEISLYNKPTKLNMYNHAQTLNVVIPNVYYKAYPSDIMLNETVKLTYKNKVYQASPVADSTSYNDEYQDYELQFKIL